MEETKYLMPELERRRTEDINMPAGIENSKELRASRTFTLKGKNFTPNMKSIQETDELNCEQSDGGESVKITKLDQLLSNRPEEAYLQIITTESPRSSVKSFTEGTDGEEETDGFYVVHNNRIVPNRKGASPSNHMQKYSSSGGSVP